MERFTVLASERIGFRPFDADDAGFLARTANDVYLQRLAHPTPQPPRAVSEFRRRLAEGYAAPLSAVRQAVEMALVRPDDERLEAIGVAGLYRIDEVNRNVEVGISLSHKADRGHGLGKEAHILVIGYAFEILGMHRVYGHVKSSNRVACELAISIGMRHEGTMREHRRHDDGYGGLDLFGVLRGEWPHRLAADRSR